MLSELNNLLLLFMLIAFAMVMWRVRRHSFKLKVRLDKEKRYARLIIDTVPSLIFVTDENLIIVAANQSFAEMVEALVDEMVGQPLGNFIKDEKILQQIRLDTLGVLRNNRTLHGGSLHLKHPKTKQWQAFTLSRRILHNGVKGVITVAQDVTSLKDALESSRQNEADLLTIKNELLKEKSLHMALIKDYEKIVRATLYD